MKAFTSPRYLMDMMPRKVGAPRALRIFSLCEPLADPLQFFPALCILFGIGHFEILKPIEDDLRYN